MKNSKPIPKSQPTPIWHQPAWLTAMVAVLGGFLTIPGHVGDYFSKEQEIAEKKIGNTTSKQDMELELVKQALGQKGTERIFLLRYLAKTADDVTARTWADEEVKRLTSVVERKKAVDAQKMIIASLETDIDESSDEQKPALTKRLLKAKEELAVKQADLGEVEQKAGLTEVTEQEYLTVYNITSNTLKNRQDLVISNHPDGFGWSSRCDNGNCSLGRYEEPLDDFYVRLLKPASTSLDEFANFPSKFELFVGALEFKLRERGSMRPASFNYNCEQNSNYYYCQVKGGFGSGGSGDW